MSPPALISAAGTPAFLNSSSARSAAQPFTRPVGSSPPGMLQGSNQPSETSLALRQSSSTSATSGGAASRSISPRRRRLTGLSGLYVLKTSSTQRSLASARSRAISAAARAAAVPVAATSADSAPATGSRAGAPSVALSASLRLKDTTVPITCCERCIGSSLELVQRGLQRGGVGLARVGGAGDTVDGTAVGSHGLLLQLRDHVVRDLLGLRPVQVHLRHADADDLAVGRRHLDLDVAEAAGEGLVAADHGLRPGDVGFAGREAGCRGGSKASRVGAEAQGERQPGHGGDDDDR